MGLFGLAMVAVAASYCSYHALILPDRLRISSLFRVKEVRYSQIEKLELIEYKLPRWIFIVALLARNLSLVGLTMDVQYGIGIRLQDGGMWRLWLRVLIGEERLVPAMQAKGVTIAPELSELAIPKGREISREDASPWSRRRLAQGVFACLTLVLCTWLWIGFNATPTVHKPPVPKAAPTSPNVILEQSRLLRAMDEVQKTLKVVMERLQKASPKEGEGLMKEVTAAKKKFDNLHHQFQALSKPKESPNRAPRYEQNPGGIPTAI